MPCKKAGAYVPAFRIQQTVLLDFLYAMQKAGAYAPAFCMFSEIPCQNLSEFNLEYVAVRCGDCKNISPIIGTDVKNVEFVAVIEQIENQVLKVV